MGYVFVILFSLWIFVSGAIFYSGDGLGLFMGVMTTALMIILFKSRTIKPQAHKEQIDD